MKRYSVLLVDDEVLAIRGVRSSIGWDRLSVGDVSVAYSMGQAQKVFAEKNIDVMLCDIEMPNGSGLDLLRWVHAEYPETVTLFLTCHSNFSYAKDALELGAIGYLLKPVPYDELQNALTKAIEKRRQMIDDTANRRYRSIWNCNKNIVEEQFWLDVLKGDAFKNTQEILTAAQKKNIALQGKSIFIPVLLRFVHFDLFLREWNREDLNYALHNIIQEIFSMPENRVFLVTVREDSCMVLVQSDEAIRESVVSRACRQLCDAFSRYLQQDILCYMGSPAMLDSLSGVYQELLSFDDHVSNQRTHIYKVSDAAACEEAGDELDIDMGDWVLLLSEGRPDAVIESAVGCLKKWEQEQRVNRHILKQFYHNVTQMVYIVLLRHNILAHILLNDEELERLNEKATYSVKDCEQFIIRIIQVSHEAIQSSARSQSVAEKVKHYIDNNLQSELTREQISNYVYLNQDYVSRLFKKEEKMSISDYICKRRMEYAKRLLESTEESISRIGEKAGYSYNSHFSKMFKRETGMTPADYRKLHRVCD